MPSPECRTHDWRPYRRVVRGPGGVCRAVGRRCRLCGWLRARIVVKSRTRLDSLRVRSAFEAKGNAMPRKAL